MQRDKRYLSTFGFIDLLFNMLVGFVFLFFIAYILINPIADEGKVDPVSYTHLRAHETN